MLEDELADVTRRLRQYLGGLTCEECGVRLSGQARGWRDLLGYDFRMDECPSPSCSARSARSGSSVTANAIARVSVGVVVCAEGRHGVGSSEPSPAPSLTVPSVSC